MSHVTTTVPLQADPNEIIDYIAVVENHPAFIGPLKSVENLSGPAQEPGTTWDWTFIMAGVEISGQAEALEYTPGVGGRGRGPPWAASPPPRTEARVWSVMRPG